MMVILNKKNKSSLVSKTNILNKIFTNIEIIILAAITLSIFITNISHPVAFIFLLLGYTLIVAVLISSVFINFWFGYLLILIFLGGLLIIFLYIARIAPNETFLAVNITNTIFLLLASILAFLIIKNIPTDTLNNEILQLIRLIKLYSQNYLITIFLIVYLLLTLMVVAKITSFKDGPLRTSTYVKANSNHPPNH